MRIKIIMMQKNEDDLLHPWLAHHGYLVGFENLHVFDNGSTSAKTLEALAWGESMGATIDRSHTSRQDFIDKGRIFTDLIHAYEAENAADFYMPLDGDEFLVVRAGETISADRKVVEAEFEQYRGMTCPLMIGAGLDNNPNMPGHFFWSLDQRKTFFAAGACGGLDHGFHVGSSKDGSEPFKTSVVYVHFHYKPYAVIQEHSREKLRPFTDDFRPEALEAYIEQRREGFHVAGHLLRTEEEYYRIFYPPNYVPIPEIAAMFERVGEELPFADLKTCR